MKKTIMISRMHCESCSKLVGMELDSLGVKSRIDWKSGKAEVEFDEKKTSIEQIKSIIKNEGYDAE